RRRAALPRTRPAARSRPEALVQMPRNPRRPRARCPGSIRASLLEAFGERSGELEEDAVGTLDKHDGRELAERERLGVDAARTRHDGLAYGVHIAHQKLHERIAALFHRTAHPRRKFGVHGPEFDLRLADVEPVDAAAEFLRAQAKDIG